MNASPEISSDPFFLCISGLSAHAVELLQGLNLTPAGALRDADGPPTIHANSLRAVELLLQAFAASADHEVVAGAFTRAARALYQQGLGAAAIDDDGLLQRMREYVQTKPGCSIREAARRSLAELDVAHDARPKMVDRLRRKWRVKKLGTGRSVPAEDGPMSAPPGEQQ